MESVVLFLYTTFAQLVSEECADTFFNHHDFLNRECLSLSISKALGYGVILGATIVKLPQIIKIVRAGSAEGVSLLSHIQELIVGIVTVTRNFRLGLPISTWGESVFISLQLVVLIFLILRFNGSTLYALPVFVALGAAFYAMLDETLVDAELHSTLQTVCIPLGALSRLTQLYSIFKSKSTGQLSVITSALNFLGMAARVVTTLKEVDDKITLVNVLLVCTLNMLIAASFFFFPSKKGKGKATPKEEKKTK